MLFSEQPMVLEARNDLAANTIPEFVALLKSSGAKMQFGSAGAGLRQSRQMDVTSLRQLPLSLEYFEPLPFALGNRGRHEAA